MYQVHQESSNQNDPVSSVSIQLSNSSMLQLTLPASMKSVVYYGGNVLATTGDNNLVSDYNDLVILNGDTNLSPNIDNGSAVPYSSDSIVLAPTSQSIVCNKPIQVTKSQLKQIDLQDPSNDENTGNISMVSYQPNSSSGNTVVTPVPDSVVCTVMPEDRGNVKQVHKLKVSPAIDSSDYASEVLKLGNDVTVESYTSRPDLPDISSGNLVFSSVSQQVVATVMPQEKKKTKQFMKSKVSSQSALSKPYLKAPKRGADVLQTTSNGSEIMVINADQIIGNISLDPSSSPQTLLSTPVCDVMPEDPKNAKRALKSKVLTNSKSVPAFSKIGANAQPNDDLVDCGADLNQSTLDSYSLKSRSENTVPKLVFCAVGNKDKINSKTRVNKSRVPTRRSVLTSEVASCGQLGKRKVNTAIKPVMNVDFVDLENGTELLQNLDIDSSKSSISENTVVSTAMTEDISHAKPIANKKNVISNSLCEISNLEADLQLNDANVSVVKYSKFVQLQSDTDPEENVTSCPYPLNVSSENTLLIPPQAIGDTVMSPDIKTDEQVNKSMLSTRSSVLNSESTTGIPKPSGWQESSSEEDGEEEVQIIFDKPVTCRAVASLPTGFLYYGSGSRKPTEEASNGVFAKKEIQRKTQFGPIEGIIHSKSVPTDHHLELSISNNGVFNKLDVSNENASNWMRYVRCAETSSEQNLSLYQIGQKLYFRAIRKIAPGEELKVWYSPVYAKERKLRLLSCKNGKRNKSPMNLPGKENVSTLEKETLLDEEVSEWSCWHCFKVFKSASTFNLHLLTHAADNLETKEKLCHDSLTSYLTDSDVPLDKKANSVCFICKKAFLTDTATLASHLKSHTKVKNFDCPICKEVFNKILYLRQHIKTHSVDGCFFCPHCPKNYKEYNQIRNHIRRFHCEKNFGCVLCSKLFSTVGKLKLHMLSHSDHREFSCETCGKQFKRKDKLVVHIKRAHLSTENQRKSTETTIPATEHDLSMIENNKSLKKDGKGPDYTEFVYKCHTCAVGFKRRGMLVNHLANRHPDITPDSVPELNLPILKAHRDYYCQYCDKIYKSSSKRKSHILKNHPGEKLPPSNREISSKESIENETYSLTVGSLTTNPQNCDWCHRQYASKAKLLQHQRKHHCNQLPKSLQRPKKATTIGLEEDTDTIKDAVLRVIDTDLFLPDTLDMSEYEASAGENRFFSGGEFIIDASTLKRAIRGEVLTADCSPETIYELGQIIDARPDGYFKVYQAHSGITLAHPVEVWDPTQLCLSPSSEAAGLLSSS